MYLHLNKVNGKIAFKLLGVIIFYKTIKIFLSLTILLCNIIIEIFELPTSNAC